LSDFKKDISDGTIGINKEAIETAIMPKDSKQIPVDLNMNSSLEVDASSSGMLNPNSATLEGFSSYAKLY
jgi:N-acetylglutamate synthase/N-acetylornithine aminotransferase